MIGDEISSSRQQLLKGRGEENSGLYENGLSFSSCTVKIYSGGQICEGHEKSLTTLTQARTFLKTWDRKACYNCGQTQKATSTGKCFSVLRRNEGTVSDISLWTCIYRRIWICLYAEIWVIILTI